VLELGHVFFCQQVFVGFVSVVHGLSLGVVATLLPHLLPYYSSKPRTALARGSRYGLKSDVALCEQTSQGRQQFSRIGQIGLIYDDHLRSVCESFGKAP
jgi:hypothetical protein